MIFLQIKKPIIFFVFVNISKNIPTLMVTDEFKKHVHKTVNKVISELRSVAKIQYGNKWNATTINPQEDNIITSAVRTFYYWNESRYTTITYLENLIDRTKNGMMDLQTVLEHSTNDPETFLKFSDLRTKFVVSIAESYSGVLNIAGAYNKNRASDDDAREKIISLADDINKLQRRYNSITPQVHSQQT